MVRNKYANNNSYNSKIVGCKAVQADGWSPFHGLKHSRPIAANQPAADEVHGHVILQCAMA